MKSAVGFIVGLLFALLIVLLFIYIGETSSNPLIRFVFAGAGYLTLALLLLGLVIGLVIVMIVALLKSKS